jgi:hypothetical protein
VSLTGKRQKKRQILEREHAKERRCKRYKEQLRDGVYGKSKVWPFTCRYMYITFLNFILGMQTCGGSGGITPRILRLNLYFSSRCM